MLHHFIKRPFNLLRNKRNLIKRLQLYCSTTTSQRKCLEQKFVLGFEKSGFLVEEVTNVPELYLTAVRLRHMQSNAEYLHIARNDPNNVFCIGFRTTPMDSTGVPHILEHNVLCGSEKFPCRDPFFKMLNRSLSTFMNAMTGSDYTVYPFSTQHPKDFKNLMSVYLDATLKPRLTEHDFMQEGWRLEHSNLSDKSSPIVFKGVVFNEMKGVFANSQQLFAQKLQNGVLPSHTYGKVSGGLPLDILSLTWEQLKAFHSLHYHPSNCHIYTYGDQPLSENLAYINDNYLKHYTKIQSNTEVPDEPRWAEPRTETIYCRKDVLAPPDKQTSVAVSYMLSNITDCFENFVLHILSELLTSGPNAPFYKSLIEPQIGTAYSAATGFGNSTKNTTFTIGLQGITENNVEIIKSIINSTVEEVIQNGFPKDRIEAILHNIELSVKHQSGNFGLSLALNLTPLWNHNGNVINALKINNLVDNFQKKYKKNPSFLQEKMVQYFGNNNHKFTLTMKPDDKYDEKLQEAENRLLEERVAVLTKENKEKIWEVGQLIAAKQEAKEDVSCLPTLQVSDISRDITGTEVIKESAGGVPIQMCQQPTNGVAYFNAVLDTGKLDTDLHPLVPLLCGILTEMGVGNLDFKSFDQKVELVCGGLNVGTHLVSHPKDKTFYEQGIHLSSHCLNENFKQMLDLWSLIFNEVNLNDMSRFSTIVKIMASNLANSLTVNGHKYAITAAASTNEYISYLREMWGGLAFLEQMKGISESNEDDLKKVLVKLQYMVTLVLNKSSMRLAVNCTPEFAQDAMQGLQSFVSAIDGECSGYQSFHCVPSTFSPITTNIHHVFPFPVHYSSKTIPGVAFTNLVSGPLQVLAKLMFQFLHREIREKGGAYGGGAMYSPGGSFSFYSYRDPQSTATLQCFDRAVQWVLSEKFTEQELSEAKLGVFQSLDTPLAPGVKGMKLFLGNVDDTTFGTHRRAVLDTHRQQIIQVAQTHLSQAPIAGTCLIGPKNEVLAKDSNWIIKTH